MNDVLNDIEDSQTERRGMFGLTTLLFSIYILISFFELYLIHRLYPLSIRGGQSTYLVIISWAEKALPVIVLLFFIARKKIGWISLVFLSVVYFVVRFFFACIVLQNVNLYLRLPGLILAIGFFSFILSGLVLWFAFKCSNLFGVKPATKLVVVLIAVSVALFLKFGLITEVMKLF